MRHSDIKLHQGDCIPGMKDNLADESIHLLVTSIPFGALFSYSHKSEDIGNNIDGTHFHGEQFGLHMRFFIQQAYRVLKPGSLACIHIQQLLRWKVQHGYMGMRDFRGSVITMFENHGFQVHGEVAITKNPQAVAQRLNLHSLMFATAYKDSRRLSPAMNDYVLLFRKPGEGEPIHGCIESQRDMWLLEPSPMIEYAKKGNVKRVRDNWKDITCQFYEYTPDGRRVIVEKKVSSGINPNGWFTKNDWVKWARGSWEDIHEIDVLDGWKSCRDSDEEKHVCPLQLEVIRRLIKLYSAPGQTVLDPFMGIGSTACVAVEQERDAVGFELKESYYDMSIKNVEKWRKDTPQLSIEDAVAAA